MGKDQKCFKHTVKPMLSYYFKFDTKHQIPIKISKKQKELFVVNVNKEQTLTVQNQSLDEVELFCYLENILDKSWVSKADISSRMNNARQAFGQLK